MDVFATHQTHNETQTLDLAKSLAHILKQDDIIMLNGPLGAGKSVFARGLIQTLSNTPNEDIPSPTFTLVQQYETSKGLLWHYDLYRLEEAEEIYETGWEDIIYQDIIVIEWAEKLQHLMPHKYINIDIKQIEENTREITIKKVGSN